MRNSFAALFCLLSLPVWAATFDTPLPDAALEARAQRLFHQIRCIVCESASIAESPSEVAGDMRAAIREKVAAGDSEVQVLDWLESRYGTAIYMAPRADHHPGLWMAPLLLLAVSLFAGWCYFRRRSG